MTDHTQRNHTLTHPHRTTLYPAWQAPGLVVPCFRYRTSEHITLTVPVVRYACLHLIRTSLRLAKCCVPPALNLQGVRGANSLSLPLKHVL